MPTKKDNLDLWNRVCETDPQHTKHVNQRGGFTAICAQSQVMAATKEFGPCGEGWGYDVLHHIIESNGVVWAAADVTLWHGDRANSFGAERGVAQLHSGQRADDDAPKKATTNALTKLLSRLGFNADVFLGLYDDNQYVSDMKAKYSNDPPPADEKGATDSQLDTIKNLMTETKVTNKQICGQYKVGDLPELTDKQAKHCIDKLKSTAEKAMK